MFADNNSFKALDIAILDTSIL
ncbi:hypothetical protein APQ04_23995 [Salmonella enterica]|nr:hypothetical protein [Salmonella enterica]EBP8178037.1 hypothetical protein [Salmonella enterica]